jgi:hypothetical protein
MAYLAIAEKNVRLARGDSTLNTLVSSGSLKLSNVARGWYLDE